MTTDERILDAALRILEEVGFRATTTRRIAEEAAVNEVTIFRHFGSKERLLLAALHRKATRDPAPPLPERPQDPAAELAAWCQVHMERLHAARHVLAASLAERTQYPDACAHANKHPSGIHAELSGYLSRAREAGLAGGDWDPRMAAAMLMGSLFATAIHADFAAPGMPTPAEAVGHYLPLFLRGIGVQTCSSR